MKKTLPRVIVAALRGGSGKTILSLGLTAAWREKGRRVAPFKKGPDFIDAGWLTHAAGRPCHNLDPFMMTDAQIRNSFFSNSSDADISLIEGNRGLFDGMDLSGCCSTAELGKLLKTPLVLIVDVTMATRTIAALVMGCQKFDPELSIDAVILNRVAGPRQQSLVRNSIERYCGLPVIGSIPKLKGDIFPERHMGLVPYQERAHAKKAISWARKAVEDNLDLEAVWDLAGAAEPLCGEGHGDQSMPPSFSGRARPSIGYVRDSAFWFYYPENLDHLRSLGAKLVEVNAMEDKRIQDVDALYIGGGFPETQAEALANNRSFRESLRREIEAGLPVYAECGGLMFLGENLIVGEKTYPMVGVLPVDFLLESKPQGHGYTMLDVIKENPYYPVGKTLKGHEFHYSRPLPTGTEKINAVFGVKRGHGFDGTSDGLCKKNLLATYTHIHAAGNFLWGEALVKAARRFKDQREKIFDVSKNRD